MVASPSCERTEASVDPTAYQASEAIDNLELSEHEEEERKDKTEGKAEQSKQDASRAGEGKQLKAAQSASPQ
eukprot:g19617.t1